VGHLPPLLNSAALIVLGPHDAFAKGVAAHVAARQKRKDYLIRYNLKRLTNAAAANP
jgi:hypothetical protein